VCLERLRAADLIVHAGDFVTVEVLRELEAPGPPLAAVGRQPRHTMGVARISQGARVEFELVVVD
jgi:predicted phosphodiesterase